MHIVRESANFQPERRTHSTTEQFCDGKIQARQVDSDSVEPQLYRGAMIIVLGWIVLQSILKADLGAELEKPLSANSLLNANLLPQETRLFRAMLVPGPISIGGLSHCSTSASTSVLAPNVILNGDFSIIQVHDRSNFPPMFGRDCCTLLSCHS